jgi:hypothetical protein
MFVNLNSEFTALNSSSITEDHKHIEVNKGLSEENFIQEALNPSPLCLFTNQHLKTASSAVHNYANY